MFEHREVSCLKIYRSIDHIDIGLKNIEENKIKATYIDSVVLIIKEVKEDVVFINYEVDGLAVIAAKVAHFFLEKKLDNIPVEWDAKTKEVTIDLKKIPELIELLKFVYISELHFVNDNILFEFYVRDKT